MSRIKPYYESVRTFLSQIAIILTSSVQVRKEQIDIFEVLDCTPQNISKDDVDTLLLLEEKESYPISWKYKFIPENSRSKSTDVTFSCSCSSAGKSDQSIQFFTIQLEGEVLRIKILHVTRLRLLLILSERCTSTTLLLITHI